MAASLPISLAQRERLSVWQSGTRCHDQPTWAWRFPARLDPDRARAAWTEVLARFPSTRTVFEPDDTGGTGVSRDCWTPERTAAATFAAPGAGDFFEALCRRLELLGGPLVRLAWAADGTETLVGVCFDHLVVDGHVVRMLLSELWTRLSGEPVTRPDPLPDDDFVRAELAAAGSAAAERDLEHWRRTTGGRTYPAPFPGLTRDPGVPAAPETAWCELELTDRSLLTRSAAMLSALTLSLARLTGHEGEPLTTLVQGTRRGTRAELQMSGFLASWLPARVPPVGSVAAATGTTTRALLAAMSAHRIHHAEVVRRLEPELYGARYRPAEVLPPYALVNYQTDLPAARVGGVTGERLAVPPVPGNILHGGLRVYGTDRADGRGASVRVVADAGAFGPGFAAAVAADLPAAAGT
jgi:hypothetical protein